MMKDNLEIIRHNVACGKESSKKVTCAREGWEAITEQYEWLIAEVDRLRKIEDAARESDRGSKLGYSIALLFGHGRSYLRRTLNDNPRPESDDA